MPPDKYEDNNLALSFTSISTQRYEARFKSLLGYHYLEAMCHGIILLFKEIIC
jgi:hypothetical protein